MSLPPRHRPVPRARRTGRAGRVLCAIVLSLAAVAGGALGGVVSAPAQEVEAQLAGSMGEYLPVNPTRLLDTRQSTAIGPGQTRALRIAGAGGLPNGGITAVTLNVTVTSPTSDGYLTVWASGTPFPPVSNINFTRGQTVANMMTVSIGFDGHVAIFNSSGSTEVIVDVSGAYSNQEGPTGGRYHSAAARRIIDTRTGQGGIAGPMGPNSELGLLMTGGGAANLPAGATAAVVNVTAVAPTSGGFLAAYPGDIGNPGSSNVNFVAGQTKANLVTVRLSSAGWMTLYNVLGATHVVVDLIGWYDTNRNGDEGRFVAVGPSRLYDTRPAVVPLSPNETRQLQLNGAAGLPDNGVGGLVANVVATQGTSDGYLIASPPSYFLPDVSSVNYVAGETVSNFVVPGRLNGFAALYNSAGWVHTIVDVFGYFVGGPSYGFDTCGVPSLSSMSAWKAASPYAVVNIYIGGLERGCRNAALDNPNWVNGARAQGWQFIPTYVGLQAPAECTGSTHYDYRYKLNPADAFWDGVRDADDAANKALQSGLSGGAPIYADIEFYARNASCTAAFNSYISGWNTHLRSRNFRPGLYSSLSAGIVDHANAVQAGAAAVDGIWIAAWNGQPKIFGFPGLSDTLWSNHQRIHQYQGGHDEGWGGVVINIDNDLVDGPVAY